ncbi:ArsR/SmtB family transcription factor [Xanthovirga aplysinae]|uniref:ArsR/SmtB family transcription factor n=1 Tax=Xanthovirga aplysinae TaxID=2529853 RepID=UPI0012BBE235|nr:helix-turn-helix domain-containing protein [Xanthovirga aplysinae]MTI29966.1 ArsR family transcriptional regulator [Xanthovirga aplysinae]
MNEEQIIEISKALGNPTRLRILKWLRDPENNFPPHEDLGHFDDGVCASHIKDKAGLSQSTISSFLSMMEKCNLIILTRHGKWSYFKRNEKVIKEYLNSIELEY